MSHSNAFEGLNERQLDGFACVSCGREEGPMHLYGFGPRSDLFIHFECPIPVVDQLLQEERDAS